MVAPSQRLTTREGHTLDPTLFCGTPKANRASENWNPLVFEAWAIYHFESRFQKEFLWWLGVKGNQKESDKLFGVPLFGGQPFVLLACAGYQNTAPGAEKDLFSLLA